MKVWIDLENSPHVPFFVPIIRELGARGIDVILTARDFAQTIDLARDAGLTFTAIGKEAGDHPLCKSLALMLRALRLAIHLRRKKIDLAVAHGSRGSLLAARLLRIPSLTLYDYEGANVRLFNRLATRVMTPDVIPQERLADLALEPTRSLRYHGLKEEVYVNDFAQDAQFASRLGLDLAKTIVTIRPPSHTAHYRSDESFKLFDEIMLKLRDRADVQVIFTPRSERQSSAIKSSRWYHPEQMKVLDKPVSGLDLLYHSDLVIGGGGTMNREAAVLGVPVISIFKGEEGAVDKALKDRGQLIDVKKATQVLPYIRKRDKSATAQASSRVKDEIVAAILAMLPKQ